MAPQSAVNLWPNNKKAFCPASGAHSRKSTHERLPGVLALGLREGGVAYDVPILVSEAPG